MARIAIDVDGTLTKGENRYWREECEPDEDMIEVAEEIYKAGHTVVIWTARPWSNASELASWLENHGVRYHGLRMEKGSADLYIDDKATRPSEITHWENPEEEIRRQLLE